MLGRWRRSVEFLYIHLLQRTALSIARNHHLFVAAIICLKLQWREKSIGGKKVDLSFLVWSTSYLISLRGRSLWALLALYMASLLMATSSICINVQSALPSGGALSWTVQYTVQPVDLYYWAPSNYIYMTHQNISPCSYSPGDFCLIGMWPGWQSVNERSKQCVDVPCRVSFFNIWA